jgi:hypothetical protein
MLEGKRGKMLLVFWMSFMELVFLLLYIEALVEIHRGIAISGLNL